MLKRISNRGCKLSQRLLDHACYPGERQTLLQKGLYRYFVCGIQNRGRRPRGFECGVCKPQAGKARQIRRFKGQLRKLENVKGCGACLDALWIRQGLRNWRAHVGVAHLRQHRAIEILDHRVDHALRMDHHFNARGWNAKQPVGLDHLQPLVHHGG